MAFPSVTQNYQGRRVDLSIFPGLRVSGQSVPAGFGPHPRVIAGPAKAAQNYARLLLTPLGSNRARPALGSHFLSRVRAGFVRYPADLASLFAIENLRVFNFLNSLPAPDRVDEQLESVVLENYALQPGGLTMTLAVRVASGDALPFLLPVVWNV
jgi:hypothetical protein